MLHEELDQDQGDNNMIKVNHKGSFKKTEKFLREMIKKNFIKTLNSYGQIGVEALASVTPVDTGLTASSWRYEVVDDGKKTRLSWINDNVTYQGTPIVILLQYGHGNGRGGYVKGYDFINPAIRPVFDSFVEQIWGEVTSA